MAVPTSLRLSAQALAARLRHRADEDHQALESELALFRDGLARQGIVSEELDEFDLRTAGDGEVAELADHLEVLVGVKPRKPVGSPGAKRYVIGSFIVLAVTLSTLRGCYRTSTEQWPDFGIGAILALTGIVAVILLGGGLLAWLDYLFISRGKEPFRGIENTVDDREE